MIEKSSVAEYGCLYLLKNCRIMNGLLAFLNYHSVVGENGRVNIGSGHKVPGYWAALAAYCRANEISYSDIDFANEKLESYSSAIALEHAISGKDGYSYERKNSGRNYSELVVLDNQDNTDKATRAINSCIRDIFEQNSLPDFVNDLCDVVGDLHDNVWSHGKSTGLSMAQKWSSYKDSEHQFFEFALADCGLGFFNELKRTNIIKVADDKEAIEWCVQEGNSSKKKDSISDWDQRLPQDIMNNPMLNIGRPVMSENNHMGLGLAKLLNLVNNYDGQLLLASGSDVLIINNGKKSFYSPVRGWNGVALSCRFDTKKVNNYKKSDDEDITSLIHLLE